MSKFIKSHGLGNDYIVFNEEDIDFPLNTKNIKKICDRNYGIGSDGILIFKKISDNQFKVKIFNPDGSEAEKSGNGIRILAKFLFEHKFTYLKEFFIETLGGQVRVNLETDNNRVKNIEVEMGKVEFFNIDEEIEILNDKLKVVSLSIGNPHCVFFVKEIDEEYIKKVGPLIENHPSFPQRTNVQMVKIISQDSIEIRIWERGAGYTLASGSSSCAAACASYRKGFVGEKVNVIMPGGKLEVIIKPSWEVILKGPAQEIFIGELSKEFLEDLRSLN
ncbi:MAG: diaminopimelate epimerase [Dictyoglomus sp.]|nr:diaminopimelate epimerase [Dictyoglomus sp.]MCX7942416.1 diaminopimelate epimerase [Dictyoglomaceae bacterium]MDW8188923.1 diaminopimelate epimerase [Dictyoglomus sp.]